MADAGMDMLTQISGAGLNIGLLLVLAVVGGAFLLLCAAMVWLALKRNWIILNWPYTGIIFRPVGTSVGPLIDKIAPIVDGNENKWKLRSLNFKFSPADRKYIMPGNYVMGWSSKFGEFLPIMPRIVGWMGQLDPEKIQQITLEAKSAELSEEVIRGLSEQILESLKKNPEFQKLAPAQQNSTFQQIFGSQLAEKRQAHQTQVFNELLEKHIEEVKELALVVKPQYDIGVANSHLAEGDKINRFFGQLDEWKQAIPWVIVLILTCLFVMAIIALNNGDTNAMAKISQNCVPVAQAAANIAKPI